MRFTCPTTAASRSREFLGQLVRAVPDGDAGISGEASELGGEVQFLMINMTGGRETVETARDFIAGRDIPSRCSMTLRATPLSLMELMRCRPLILLTRRVMR